MSTDPGPRLPRAAGVLILFLLTSSTPGRADAQSEHTVLLHAHGALAHGWETVETLQRDAASRGIEAVFLAEHLIASWEWAPPVVRGVWRWHGAEPSVSSHGIERYFREAVAADRAVPEVALFAGLEVAPWYGWEGSLLDGTLTMRSWQRNLLLLDPPAPERLTALPVTGIRSSLPGSPAGWIWLVLVLALAGAGLHQLERMRWLRAACLLALALLTAWPGPPRTGGTSPWTSGAGWAPWQAFIQAASEESFTVWSQVESVDDRSHRLGPFRLEVRTDAHPEAVTETAGYGAFGVVYPTTVTLHRPGSAWDLLLHEYLTGRRAAPVWGWGEAALHYPDQIGSKRVDEVLSVLLSHSAERDALLEALRGGRGYAVRAALPGGRLRLDGFSAVSGDLEAGAGQDLVDSGGHRVAVSVSMTGPRTPQVVMRLVRSGEVVASAEGIPPLRIDWGPPAGEPAMDVYYRVVVEGRDDLLVTNPVFVRRPG